MTFSLTPELSRQLQQVPVLAFDGLALAFKTDQAAEAGGGVGFLLRPPGALRAPSFANLRLRIAPLAATDAARRLRVEVVRCRGGKDGQIMTLEIGNEKSAVRLLPEVASPAARARKTRRSG